MQTTPQRLDALRKAMRREGLTHYLVPSADEHLNEYPPAWRLRRQWVSGFTGSAGDLLVGLAPTETWLFVDGRYHLRAAQELEGSGLGLQRVGVEGAKTLRQVLADLSRNHGSACRVGYDPMTLAVSVVDGLTQTVEPQGAALVPVPANLVDPLWLDRPTPASSPLFPCPAAWTGRDMGDKVTEVRAMLRERGADALVEVKLDRIAWLTNLRSSSDIPYNPVFEAYLYLDQETVRLFLHQPRTRLPFGFVEQVPGFAAASYEEFLPFLRTQPHRRVFLDSAGVTQAALAALESNSRASIRRGLSPVVEAKAIKNSQEQEAMARAGQLASAAKTRALLWLDREVAAGSVVTERRFADVLEAMYRDLEGFAQLSFATIAAAGAHGAIVHYGGAGEVPLTDGQLFLVDSGIHLAGGSTDDTRTVAVGVPTAEQRRVYTLVLKAHIAGAALTFPEGTPGSAIDAITRALLWNEGLNYDHGTGHGVGAFLNVHEGPFALAEAKQRKEGSYGLKGGMITSIEPGYYREGFGGVRLENLYRIEEAGRQTDGRKWLSFVPLTWIPFDPRLIDSALLTPAESDWIAGYHRDCRARLAPLLSLAERAQLGEALAGSPGFGDPVR